MAARRNGEDTWKIDGPSRVPPRAAGAGVPAKRHHRALERTREIRLIWAVFIQARTGPVAVHIWVVCAANGLAAHGLSGS